jgi:hypothetical protein
VSYAFNFNLGATVGAVGFRYRLYSASRVDTARIAAILACSIVTNWCGCLAVLGAMLIADPSALDFGWELPAVAGRALGFAALLPVAGYWPTRLRHGADPDPRNRASHAEPAVRARADRSRERLLAAGSPDHLPAAAGRCGDRLFADRGGLRDRGRGRHHRAGSRRTGRDRGGVPRDLPRPGGR